VFQNHFQIIYHFNIYEIYLVPTILMFCHTLNLFRLFLEMWWFILRSSTNKHKTNKMTRLHHANRAARQGATAVTGTTVIVASTNTVRTSAAECSTVPNTNNIWPVVSL
jgi:hypothetical protein